MTYYILHNSAGELIGVNNTELPKTLLFDATIIQVNDQIPDLNKVIWNPDILQFESNTVPLTRLDFMSRFTTTERIAIYNSADLVVQDALMLLQSAQFIDVTDFRTISAINYFSQVGLLDQSRITEILQ
jgi:hypothetical protein